MEGDGDLDNFRTSWVHELNERKDINIRASSENKRILGSAESAKNSKLHCNNEPLCRNDDVKFDIITKSTLPFVDKTEKLEPGEQLLSDNNIVDKEDLEAAEGYYPFVLLGKMLKSGSEEYAPRTKRKSGESSQTLTSPPIFKKQYFEKSVWSSCDSQRESNTFISETKSLNSTTVSCKAERFLDLFVADLDDINEIPFFDTSLAREVAVKIFRYLSITDLCRCSQVSRSWRSLADDELLWCRLCRKLGYEGDVAVIEKLGWKNTVRHYVERRKSLLTNWKGRVGKFHQLQHVQGGILCSVDSHQDTIVSGYTNCDVKLWNMIEDDNVIYQSSNTALVIDESSDVGTVSNQVQQVVTSKEYTAASYTHGFVDIWCYDSGTKPVYTLQPQHGQVNQICLSHNKPLLAVSGDSSVQILQAEEHENFDLVETIHLNKVGKLKWLEVNTRSQSTNPKLILGEYSKVHLYDTVSHDVIEIHNMIDTNTRCFDCRLQPDILAVGVHFFSPVAEHKIKLYDLTTKQMTSTLHGHTWIISCLYLHHDNQNHLVSGSGDRKVRLYDMRLGGQPVMTLIGHAGSISSVQFDDYKIVSSDVAGFVSVRDIRTQRKLWELHNRHPVEYCKFYDRYLTVGNVPINKSPDLDIEFESTTHRKYRGTVQVYDFLSDQLRDNLPDICLSTYDQAPAYNFNIRLTTPYDNL